MPVPNLPETHVAGGPASGSSDITAVSTIDGHYGFVGYANTTFETGSGTVIVTLSSHPGHLAFGMDRDELIKRFVGWQLVDARPVPGERMHQYISGPKLMRAALRHGRFRPRRYRFERSG